MDLPYKEIRPWGNFVQLTDNEIPTVKVITVNAGQAFSLQYHDHRDEFWYVTKGSGVIRVGEENIEAHEGDNFSIPRGTIHRATGGPEGLTFVEVAHGTFREDDIHRLEDRYGRVKE